MIPLVSHNFVLATFEVCSVALADLIEETKHAHKYTTQHCSFEEAVRRLSNIKVDLYSEPFNSQN